MITVLASAGAAITRGLGLQLKDKRLVAASRLFSYSTFAAASAMLVLLAYLFLSSDMSYMYVWSNSSSDLGTLYKLSGVWAGAQGSFMLWIWLMSLGLVIEVALERRRNYLTGRFHGVLQLSVSGIIFLFMLILFGMQLFERTPAFYLQAAPAGSGMNLVLQTPEMALHPPVVFAGYAFCVLVLASAAAYFATGERNWVRVSLPWTRIAWIFLTLGIGIGAIWAYYVLGWGGYWGWDPVETASLLPWIVATAFLHTQLRHARKGEYKIMSPALGMLSFVAVMFATFATRAGAIWQSTVHSFTNLPDIPSASGRLSYLLQHDSTVLGIFSLMLLLLVTAVYLAYDKYRSTPKPEEEPEPEKISEYVSDKNNMLLTTLLFVVTSAIILLLMFKNLNVLPQANYDEFNQKMSFFFVATMTVLSVCLLWKFVGKARALYLGLGMIAASAVIAVLGGVTGSVNWLVGFSLPSYLVAVGASAFKLMKSVGGRSLGPILRKAGPQVVHIGVALVLMGYVVSSNLQAFPASTTDIEGMSGSVVRVGDSVTVGDFSIRLVSLSTSTSQATSFQTDTAIIEITRSGSVAKPGVGLSNIYGSSGNAQIDVYVFKTVFEDLYVDFQLMNGTTALVQVKTVPFMNTLWIGFALLVVGLTMRTVAWRPEPPEEQVPKGHKPTEVTEIGGLDVESQARKGRTDSE